MGYSEEDGAVVLRMKPDDYSTLLLGLGFAIGCASTKAGNRNFRPYDTAGEAHADPR